jgi:putative endonuclease
MYIVECADGSLYVGSTVDLERRIAEHNAGQGAAYTRSRRPVRLLHAEEYSRIDDAFAREKQVQNWSRAKRMALIEGRLAALPRLSKKPRRSPPVIE